MEIKVLGPGCPKCKKAEKIIKEVVSESGSDARVEKITDMMEIASYGIVSTPAIVVNGEVKSKGKIPKINEIKAWLKM
ncbi:MAG: TM0996/MTH895 family glutaredoxin-like protein [Deltaproteobacteria bacterium]|nr:TM0996/MTH895 family glutaredoxin-like protein [Deltaproteobacteria bacterium]MBW2180591.1 TM0996/MTH895 family glutaredoxin-like protein [Deltaproteobacteria bacterium]